MRAGPRVGAAPGTGGKSGIRGWPWRAAAFIIVGALVIGWLLARFETHQLYYPTPVRGETPAGLGIPFNDVRIATEDGETIHAWWLPGNHLDAPVILFLHGNAGNREDRLHNLHGLWQAGMAVLIIDYRGYGGSSGAPYEEGLYRDGVAAFDWLRAKAGPRPITLFGRSLGSAVAAQVALRRPAAGLILESAFTSAPEVARHIYPIPGIGRLVRSRFDTLAAVKQLSLPLLIIHGTADTLIPFSMGEALYDAAASPQKTFRPVPGGGHNDTYLLAAEDYYLWWGEFLGSQ